MRSFIKNLTEYVDEMEKVEARFASTAHQATEEPA
jgi:hypothetical protein